MGMASVFKSARTVFLVVTTCICIALALLGNRLAPRVQFGFGIFWQILLIAIVSAALTILFYSRKELGTLQMGIRIIIHFASTFLAIVFLVGGVFQWISLSAGGFGILALVIIVIYAIVMLSTVMLQYFRAVVDADALNTQVRKGLRMRGKTEPTATRRDPNNIHTPGRPARVSPYDEEDEP